MIQHSTSRSLLLPQLPAWTATTAKLNICRGNKPWCLQAYLTRRKKDKVFAVYDLNIVLCWDGHWVEDDKKASYPCPST